MLDGVGRSPSVLMRYVTPAIPRVATERGRRGCSALMKVNIPWKGLVHVYTYTHTHIYIEKDVDEKRGVKMKRPKNRRKNNERKDEKKKKKKKKKRRREVLVGGKEPLHPLDFI